MLWTIRSIELQGRALSYHLQITRRRNIAILVSPEKGLLVRAPRRTAVKDIEAALGEQASWIFLQLDKLAARGLPRPPLAWRGGDKLPLRGGHLTLCLQETLSRRGAARCREGELILQLPFELSGQERQNYIKKLVIAWYKRQAGQTLPFLAARYCAQLNLPLPELKIARAKSRWGSCNSRGVLFLSWRLLLLPEELCAYVVAHEICHLRHFNHSRDFWELLGQLLPQAHELRQKLDREGAAYLLD